jgi:hypothetical protein
MLPLDQFTINTTIEEDTYEYQNQMATYHLKFIPEVGMRDRCMILCDQNDFKDAITKEIDKWDVPQELDLLDMNAIVYDVSNMFGTVYFLHGYTIEITIAEMNTAPVDDTITLPDFTSNENRGRIIKSFKNFD